MSKKGKKCPYCGKDGLKSKSALDSHIRAKHPNMKVSPPGHPEAPPMQHISVDVPLMEPGQQPFACPFCNSQTQVFIKEDGTIASSSEIPKPPSSSTDDKGLRRYPKRAAHPIVIKERFEQRRRPDGTFKNTVCMMGTHGRTAPKMPWYEPGIKEHWLLNDSHSIQFVTPHVEAGRVDRWWQMHHRWRFTRRMTRLSDDHWTWLQESKIPRIFMQRKYADVPNSEGFKLREISEMFIGDKLGRGAGYVQVYYTNTFSYMIAQVMYEKAMGIEDWERIEIYGCELEQIETEYFRQRPGMEWWLGAAAQMGIQVYFPHDTFIAYAQDVVIDKQRGTSLIQYPGYMAYGFKSPSMKEAEEQNLPLGVDPVEENVMGAWEGYHMWFIHAMNEGLAQAQRRHSLLDFDQEIKALEDWFDGFEEDVTA